MTHHFHSSGAAQGALPTVARSTLIEDAGSQLVLLREPELALMGENTDLTHRFHNSGAAEGALPTVGRSALIEVVGS